MRPQRSFRSSGSWSLEDRIALSQAGAVAEVASATTPTLPHTATFHGVYATTEQSGVNAQLFETHLRGSSQIAQVGNVHVSGSLKNDVVTATKQNSKTEGTLVIYGAVGKGRLVLDVTGKFAKLDPTAKEKVPLTFTVKSATGAFASFAHGKGTVELTLAPSASGSAVHRGEVTVVVTKS
jgi:hypothetical protein